MLIFLENGKISFLIKKILGQATKKKKKKKKFELKMLKLLENHIKTKTLGEVFLFFLI